MSVAGVRLCTTGHSLCALAELLFFVLKTPTNRATARSGRKESLTHLLGWELIRRTLNLKARTFKVRMQNYMLLLRIVCISKAMRIGAI